MASTRARPAPALSSQMHLLTAEVFSWRAHDSESDARREKRVPRGCERLCRGQFPAHEVDEYESSGHLGTEV